MNLTDWENLDLERTIDLGKQEIPLSEVWDWLKLGQRVSTASALVLVTNREDFHDIIKAISSDARSAHRRAMRVTRHLNKVIDHLDGAKAEFGKCASTIKTVFAPEFEQLRGTQRRKVNLTK